MSKIEDKKDLSFSLSEKANVFTNDSKSFMLSLIDAQNCVRDHQQNQILNRDYVDNFKNLVGNMKTNSIKIDGTNNNKPFQVDKENLKNNQDYLIAQYAK